MPGSSCLPGSPPTRSDRSTKSRRQSQPRRDRRLRAVATGASAPRQGLTRHVLTIAHLCAQRTRERFSPGLPRNDDHRRVAQDGPVIAKIHPRFQDHARNEPSSQTDPGQEKIFCAGGSPFCAPGKTAHQSLDLQTAGGRPARWARWATRPPSCEPRRRLQPLQVIRTLSLVLVPPCDLGMMWSSSAVWSMIRPQSGQGVPIAWGRSRARSLRCAGSTGGRGPQRCTRLGLSLYCQYDAQDLEQNRCVEARGGNLSPHHSQCFTVSAPIPSSVLALAWRVQRPRWLRLSLVIFPGPG